MGEGQLQLKVLQFNLFEQGNGVQCLVLRTGFLEAGRLPPVGSGAERADARNDNGAAQIWGGKLHIYPVNLHGNAVDNNVDKVVAAANAIFLVGLFVLGGGVFTRRRWRRLCRLFRGAFAEE